MKQAIYRVIFDEHINAILRRVNKTVYPFLPYKIKIAPSGTLLLRGEKGRILKIKTNQTSYLTQLIFWNGYRNFEYTDIFLRLIKKVSVFYDIGANIGYYSLLAAMENKDIRVVGFEPASGSLHYFNENVRINKFTNIVVEPLALSEHEGRIMFYEVRNKKYSYLEHNLSGESNAGRMTGGKNFVPHEVETTTLDHYAIETGEKNIDLIKMDTEGTEHHILEKSQSVLENMKPVIICETLFNTIEAEIEAIMKNHGYQCFNHLPAGLKQVKSIVRKEDDGVRNCFFVHPSKFHLIEEFVI